MPLKLSYFLHKNAKFLSAVGFSPDLQPLAAGALPPDPHRPPAARGFAPRPPNQPPSIANFWLRTWLIHWHSIIFSTSLINRVFNYSK